MVGRLDQPGQARRRPPEFNGRRPDGERPSAPTFWPGLAGAGRSHQAATRRRCQRAAWAERWVRPPPRARRLRESCSPRRWTACSPASSRPGTELVSVTTPLPVATETSPNSGHFVLHQLTFDLLAARPPSETASRTPLLPTPSRFLRRRCRPPAQVSAWHFDFGLRIDGPRQRAATHLLLHRHPDGVASKKGFAFATDQLRLLAVALGLDQLLRQREPVVAAA